MVYAEWIRNGYHSYHLHIKYPELLMDAVREILGISFGFGYIWNSVEYIICQNCYYGFSNMLFTRV